MTAEAAGSGHTLHPITADITRSDDVERMTAEAIDALGHIDILVNNAGTCYHGESWVVTDEQWDEVFDLNVKALWACSLSVGAHMRERGSGFGGEHRVDIGAHREPAADATGLQRIEGGGAPPHQIPCRRMGSAGHPGQRAGTGLLKTDMAPVDRPDLKRYWIDDAPQQRYAMPEEIAPSVVFLASDAASFITGSVLVADGGYTAW